MLHHHVLPLPADHLVERLATWIGLPNAAELGRGRELIEVLLGRADLVLHGHRHVAAEVVLAPSCGRALRVLNAGSSPEAGRVRVLAHLRGRIVEERWIEARVTAAAGGVSGPASLAAA
jgi:hypothetical protein